MKKYKNFENFEISNLKDNKQRINKIELYVKICILLILIIFFQIIYIICIQSYSNGKKDELIQVNFKKYLLDNGNKKLYQELNEDILTKYSDEELLNKLENEIKRKNNEISNFKNQSNYLLNNFSPTTETLVKIKEENNKRILEIKDLKTKLINSNKSFRDKYNTKIIDSLQEFNTIEILINNNNIYDFKLCYSAVNNEIDYSEAYNKCDLSRDISFLIVFQTDKFERYGIYLSTIKDNNSLIFSFNFRKKERQLIELTNTQRQSIIYLLNLIKEMIFNNGSKDKIKDNDKDNIKYLNITDLEIFHI